MRRPSAVVDRRPRSRLDPLATAFQRLDDRPGIGKSLAGLLRQQSRQDLSQTEGQVSDALEWRGLSHMLVEDLAIIPTAKGRGPRQHLPEQASQRILIRSPVDFARLLALLGDWRRGAVPRNPMVGALTSVPSPSPANPRASPKSSDLNLPRLRVRLGGGARF